MTCSACCTMRSRFAVLSLFLLLWPFTLVGAQTPAAASSTAVTAADLSPSLVVDANSLGKDGKRPFYLKVSFEIFDLQGGAADQGTLEYWWAGQEGSRIEIRSATLGTLGSTDASAAGSPVALRSLYLVRELLDDINSPGAALGPASANVATEARTVAGVSLECMHPVPPPALQTLKLVAGETTICADRASGTIRLVSASYHEITRNHPAVFGQTRVALDVAIFWSGKRAITGHIDQLKSFDPSKSAVALEKASSPQREGLTPAGNPHIPGGVLAGNKISGSQPIYPELAKQRRITGTVVLAAEITKEGKIANLVPLASPDAALTNAAVEAVSNWKYKPYLLNGEPVSVSTTITVNFNLNSRLN
jgi:TonB family protein